MSNSRIRVWELAKDLGLSNQECLLLTQSLGIAAKSALSTISKKEASDVTLKHSLKLDLRRNRENESLCSECFMLVHANSSLCPMGLDICPQISKNESNQINKKRQRTRWPLPGAYDDSLFDPKHWMASSDLKSMKVEPAGPLGHTSIYQTGGFAVVAKAVIEGEVWAIRLLYKQQEDLEERYQVIQNRQSKGELLDVMVPVEYRDDEIGVSGFTDRFPVILVKWVDGTVFNRFVEEACRSKDIEGLKKLHSAMAALESRMRGLRLAHGDLSGDNMMVTNIGNDFELKLLDYDSLWLPEIESLKSAVGDGELQHPGVSKSSSGSIGPAADYVAFRIYDLGLRALIENPELGTNSSCFEHKFLVTREEISQNSSDVTRIMRQLDEKQFEDLVTVLKTSYDDLSIQFLQVLAVEDSIQNEVATEAVEVADEDVHDPIWTLASLVELWQLSVGDIRKLASRAGVSNDELSRGISSSVAAEIARSSEHAALLNYHHTLTLTEFVSKKQSFEKLISLKSFAEQNNLDLKYLVDYAKKSGYQIEDSSNVTPAEVDDLQSLFNPLIAVCTVDLNELARKMRITNVRQIRNRMDVHSSRWVVRRGGLWLVDPTTADQILNLHSKRSDIRTIATEFLLDVNFVEKLAVNLGIKRDVISSLDDFENTRLRDALEVLVKECSHSLETIVSRSGVSDERVVRKHLKFGQDVWLVSRDGQWNVDKNTAERLLIQFPLVKILPTHGSRWDQYREIEIRNRISGNYLSDVAREILGSKFSQNSILSPQQIERLEFRIAEDSNKYPIDLTKVLIEKSLDQELVLSEIPWHLFVRRSYGVRGSEMTLNLVESIEERINNCKVSRIAKSLSVSVNFLLEVVDDVLGLKDCDAGTVLTDSQRDLVKTRILEDREKFPFSIAKLSSQTGSTLADLVEGLQPGRDNWISRSYGIYLDGETAERIKMSARKDRELKRQVQISQQIKDKHQAKTLKSMSAAEKTNEVIKKYPNRLAELTSDLNLEMSVLKIVATRVAKTFGNPKEHLINHADEIRISDDLLLALLENDVLKGKSKISWKLKKLFRRH